MDLYWQTSFSASGPTLWDSLPLTVREPSLSLTQFYVCLNIALLFRAYQTSL